MAEKVTLSLGTDTLARARAAAEREGMTLSAWMERAARRAALRDAARRHAEWVQANPAVQEEITAWRGFVGRNRPGRWTAERGDGA